MARQFASLDHLSGGRAAWNVTSANDCAALHFGHAKLAPHADRYRRAGEFVDVVRQLWDSWDDGAFVLDRASGGISTRRRNTRSTTTAPSSRSMAR